MRRYYFELPDGDRMRYLWSHETGLGGQPTASRTLLSYQARRIWEEREDGAVTYIKLKSRCISDMSRVDMREFAWVKLCAQPLSKKLDVA